VLCRLEQRTFSVTNEGDIAKNDLPRIFDARYTTGGHGMGLYLVRRICERYGWRIDIGSTARQTVASVLF